MSLAGAGLVEDYREMILGQVAEQVDATRLFAESRSGEGVTDTQVDDWIHGAVQSAERWRDLFSPDLGMTGDPARLKPTLTSDDFKAAFQLACVAQGVPLRETRNSRNQFVPGVYNFELPAAFRDPVFRPSRTLHVVFDRAVYAAVRGQDLGTVRGQPIRPLLAGFGEPVTDWLFQTDTHARAGESAFGLRAGTDWPYGPGWLLVYALRWLGRSRRLSSPDSIAVCFASESGEVLQLSASQAMKLATQAEAAAVGGSVIGEGVEAIARRLAQQSLRACAANRDALARGAAGLSLLLAALVSD